MLMSIHWGHECTFVFVTLSTDSWFLYILGCLISGMFAGLAIAAPTIKKKIFGKPNSNSNSNTAQDSRQGSQNKRLLLTLCYYLAYASLHVLTMMLIMTYNGGVILTMVFFGGIGYFLFGAHDADADMPINCCAGTA